jgi:1,2-phenylacetyl-CoA epoxidase catalytic subunit
MRDFPKWLNTKQDYLNCLQDFPEQIRQRLQELLTDRFLWVQTGILSDEDQGVTDDTHRIIETENERFQYEYLEDSNARIFQLGFTVQEIEELIK